MEKNLDLECAKCGSKIARSKDDETLITKSLGVLQEDGIYAFYLYLKAKSNSVYESIENETKKLLKAAFPSLNITQKGYEVARDVASDLDQVLLAKQLLEKTLVYARYHAKAL